ncbi:MAG: serine hydrolase domain-containing protein [Planctomycetota bacterium]
MPTPTPLPAPPAGPIPTQATARKQRQPLLAHLVAAAALACVATLALTIIGCGSDLPNFPKNATLEQKIELAVDHMRVPGAAVAVYKEGQPVVDRAFGVASLETNEPLTTAHHFRIASITKAVIGTALVQLADEGLLSLDDPISNYVYSVPNGDAITLRMLAQHTSGLYNYVRRTDMQAAFAADRPRVWTEDELLQPAFETGPRFEPPGSKWAYTNTGYILLGQVIEQIEGEPLAAVIDRRICQPLGLTGMGYTIDQPLPEPFAAGHQLGTSTEPSLWRGRGSTVWDVTDASPSMWHAAGAMHSTAGETRVMIEAIATGELVSERGFAEQTVWRESWGSGNSYGLGLMQQTTAKGNFVGHNGMVPGYQVAAFHDREPSTTIVVLANLYASPRNAQPADVVSRLIAEHLASR